MSDLSNWNNQDQNDAPQQRPVEIQTVLSGHAAWRWVAALVMAAGLLGALAGAVLLVMPVLVIGALVLLLGAVWYWGLREHQGGKTA